MFFMFAAAAHLDKSRVDDSVQKRRLLLWASRIHNEPAAKAVYTMAACMESMLLRFTFAIDRKPFTPAARVLK